jgi:hypothetical protein
MKNKDWLLRIKGKHAVTVFTDGEVRYSVGKQKLFILKKDALQELESLVRLNLSVPNDSTTGNVIRFKDRKEVFTLYNRELYTKIWKIIYDADNVKGNIDELAELTLMMEYAIIHGDIDSDVPLEVLDPHSLIQYLDIDVYNDSLINLILTKNNELYY